MRPDAADRAMRSDHVAIIPHVEALFPVFIVAFIAIVIACVVFGHIAEKKRQEEILKWEREGRLAVTGDKDYSFDHYYSHFGCLRNGSNRYAYNILRGRLRERSFVAFDYHYQTTSTDSKGRTQTHHHHFSAAIVDSEIPLKELIIRPETFGDKLAGFFGWDDIDFESAEFSRRFYVKAPDRKWAYDVIHQRTMEFLLGQPKVSIEFDRACVIAWDGGRWGPARYEHAISVVEGILDRLPLYVVQQQKEMGGK